MASMHDGVSKIWILRRDRGLDVAGYKDELEAIDALIRIALTWGPDDMRSRIEGTVTKALKHLEEGAPEEPGPESDEA